MCILFGAFLLTLLEAAALWLLGVFDRPKFVWDDSFLADESYWHEKEENEGRTIVVDDDDDNDECDGVGNDRRSSRKGLHRKESSQEKRSPDQVYVLMALCKSKRVSTRLVCPMLSRTRRAILETTTTTTTPTNSEPHTVETAKPTCSVQLQDLLTEGATAYGALPDTRGVAVGLYFMDETCSSSSSSKSNRSTWRWRRRSSSSNLEQEKWGCGWLLGATTNMEQLQAMMMTASQHMSPELFIPSCRNDSPSLVFDMKAFRIQVPGPVVKGRIACRSFLSPYLARWLHWRRAQALFDDPQQLQQQQQQETESSLPSCNSNNSDGANNTNNNNNNNNMAAGSNNRPCVRFEMYMIGADHVPQYIDYILVGADRVCEVERPQTLSIIPKTKLA